MAEYNFQCRKCGRKITVTHGMHEPHPTHHEGCGGELGRVFDSQARVVYKAVGFTKVDKRFEPNPRDM